MRQLHWYCRKVFSMLNKSLSRGEILSRCTKKRFRCLHPLLSPGSGHIKTILSQFIRPSAQEIERKVHLACGLLHASRRNLATGASLVAQREIKSRPLFQCGRADQLCVIVSAVPTTQHSPFLSPPTVRSVVTWCLRVSTVCCMYTIDALVHFRRACYFYFFRRSLESTMPTFKRR